MDLRNNIFAFVFDWLCERKMIDGQKDLARKTSISENTITNILNGKTKVSDKTLHKLNDGFNGIFNMQYLRGRDQTHMLIENVVDDSISYIAPYKSSQHNNNNMTVKLTNETKGEASLMDLATRLIREVEGLRICLTSEIDTVEKIKKQLKEEHETMKTINRQLTIALNKARGIYSVEQMRSLSAADPTATNQ